MIYAEDKTRVTGERREKFRENLDKLLDISGSDGIEQIRREKKRILSSAD